MSGDHSLTGNQRWLENSKIALPRLCNGGHCFGAVRSHPTFSAVLEQRYLPRMVPSQHPPTPTARVRHALRLSRRAAYDLPCFWHRMQPATAALLALEDEAQNEHGHKV